MNPKRRIPQEGSGWFWLQNTAVCASTELFPANEPLAQQDEAALNGFVAAVETSFHPDELGFSGGPSYQVGTVYFWPQILASGLNQSNCRDFVYMGHGSPTNIGNAGNFLYASNVAATLGNNGTLALPYNLHPYRFVFIDGCDTESSGDWATAFGIQPQAGLTSQSFVNAGLRPRAFVGWTKAVQIGFNQAGDFDPPHQAFIEGFWLNWSAPGLGGSNYIGVQAAINIAGTTNQLASPGNCKALGANDLRIWQ